MSSETPPVDLAALAGERWDVVVAGGGPAGATAAAILAGEYRRKVLLLERHASPKGNPGETLTSAVHAVLARIGATQAVDAAGFVPLKEVRLYLGDRCVRCDVGEIGEFRPLRPYGLGVRRDELDAILMASAERAGAVVARGVRLAGLDRAGGAPIPRITDKRGEVRALQAKVLVAAEGRGSVAARALGLRRAIPFRDRIAIHTYFGGVRGLGESAEGYVSGPVLVSVAPVGLDRVNVFATMPLAPVKDRAGAAAQLAKAQRESKNLGARLDGAEPIAELASYTHLAYGSRRLYQDGVLLVGDAAASHDPITTSGVTLAMREAEWAADAIGRWLAGGEPSGEPYFAEYERVAQRLLRGRQWFNQLLFAIGDQPLLLDRITARIDKDPVVRALFFGVFQSVIPVGSLFLPRVLLRLAVG